MENYSYEEVKNACNECLYIINDRLKVYDDPIKQTALILPQCLRMIAVNAFAYGEERYGDHIKYIRDGIKQLDDKGFIGDGK